MMRQLRQERLLDHLRSGGAASVQDLVEVLDSSPATIRRDLEQLAEAGALERVWGGARIVAEVDDPFAEALMRQADAKRDMAERAASLVSDGLTIALDIGTSIHYLASLLLGRSLTVITASLPVFETLKDVDGIDLVMLGGDWSPRYQCFSGSVTSDAIARFSPDIAFIGCSGVTDLGQVRDNSDAQVQVKRALAAVSARRVLLADSTKFPGQGSATALTMNDIDVLVTDAPLPDALAGVCDEHHTEVLHP